MGDDPNGNLTVATCPECKRRVRIVNPPGGDGTARIFVRHGKTDHYVTKPQCRGSRIEVRL